LSNKFNITILKQQQTINMEKRINKKIEVYLTQFKDEVKNKLVGLNFDDKSKVNELLEYVYDYDRMALSKDDFIKRKRVKNAIPLLNRCNAKRANNEQCTRRRKEGCEFCGTHSKGTPHGLIQIGDTSNTNQKLDVFVEDIRGIVYYIDKFNNVYRTEDILAGKENPEIIAQYVKNGITYTIPELGLF